MAMGFETETGLDRFRGYFYVVAWRRVAARLRGKFDPSDLVPQTLLKRHQSLDRRKIDNDARGAWLRQILANTIIDEVRR